MNDASKSFCESYSLPVQNSQFIINFCCCLFKASHRQEAGFRLMILLKIHFKKLGSLLSSSQSYSSQQLEEQMIRDTELSFEHNES